MINKIMCKKPHKQGIGDLIIYKRTWKYLADRPPGKKDCYNIGENVIINLF